MKASERKHLSRVADLGCLICGNPFVEIHHVRTGNKKRDHSRVIPLCHRHHRTGGYGVAVHAGRLGWQEAHLCTEKDLVEITKELLEGEQL